MTQLKFQSRVHAVELATGGLIDLRVFYEADVPREPSDKEPSDKLPDYRLPCKLAMQIPSTPENRAAFHLGRKITVTLDIE